jgi:RNA polymerase sigma-70 factor (ECF subfamily)
MARGISRRRKVNDPAHSLLDALVRHRAYLTRYAYSKLRHSVAAEDVVQEALAAAVEGRSKFKGESAPLTWLVGILKHKIVDWQRREARNPTNVAVPAHVDIDLDQLDDADALFDEDGRWANPPSEWANPEQAFENRRFWEMLEGCLAELPPAIARAFYLREIQGLATNEICAELDISESNCWVMLHRARMSLREKIQERWADRGGARSAGQSRTRSAAKKSRIVPGGDRLAHSMG